MTQENPKAIVAEGGGGGIPPQTRNGLEMGEPEEPQGRNEADLFWALNSQSLDDFPSLDVTLEKYGLTPEQLSTQVSKKQVGSFIEKAKKRGLIKKPRGLSLREYISAFFLPKQ